MKIAALSVSIAAALVLPGFSATTISVSGSTSAGNGSMSLLNATSFVITSNYTGLIAFVIDGSIGSPSAATTTLANSTLTYTINGGAPILIGIWGEGYNEVGMTPDDSLLYGNASSSFVVGDVVTLSFGDISMQGMVPNFTLPTSGTYEMYIVSDSGAEVLSGNGVAIPEPASSALACLAGIGFIMRRRK